MTRPMHNDPLWNLRHAIAGVALALLLAVLLAALAGRVVGDLLALGYGARVAIYGALLLYVVAGAAVLLVRLAQHEKRPLSAGRVALWLASLWLWPLLLLAARRSG
ncbi:MAG: hypothetical protein GX886_15465 [Comamonadaceae bacterium]|nr:hypothetical protein [Rubrivivax sp.]NLZ42623.1 hypothetical protein [Comamonadaceae bacterium]